MWRKNTVHSDVFTLIRYLLSIAWKTADIARRLHWFPREMTSGKQAKKWCVTTQIWVVLLIGHDALETCFNQSEELPGLVIDASSEKSLRSFLRCHFAGKSCSVGVARCLVFSQVTLSGAGVPSLSFILTDSIGSPWHKICEVERV